MDKTTDMISTYAESLDFSDLTPEAIHAVKRTVIDSLGCALGACNADTVKIARKLASSVTGTMPASLLGTSLKTSPEWAAFANGVMVRYLDFNDDYLYINGSHPSDNVPAVLAMAEALKADGKTTICGIVLTYEIICQFVDADAAFMRKGWDYATEASLGSALGVGKILGLSKEKMSHAVSLAIVPNIALFQTRTGEISLWKVCAGPNGARNGVFAAMLAREGMTGPNQIFEGPCGLWNQVTGAFELGHFGGKGNSFKIEQTYLKYRPVMYTALLPVETALELRKKLNIHDIDSVRIVLDKTSCFGSKHPEKWDPHTRETVINSIPYLVVATLLDGELSERTFKPERYRDPRILALLKKTILEEADGFTSEFPKTFNCLIEVREKSGQRWSLHLKNPKGHPANPMSDTEIEDKFLSLTERWLTHKQAKDALGLLWNLERLGSVSAIFDSLQVVQGSVPQSAITSNGDSNTGGSGKALDN